MHLSLKSQSGPFRRIMGLLMCATIGYPGRAADHVSSSTVTSHSDHEEMTGTTGCGRPERSAAATWVFEIDETLTTAVTTECLHAARDTQGRTWYRNYTTQQELVLRKRSSRSVYSVLFFDG